MDLILIMLYIAIDGDYAQLISNFGRYQKTPMGKKRAKILEGDDEEKGKDGKKKK